LEKRNNIKNHFRQHIPNFFDQIPKQFDFSTQEELLNNPLIKEYSSFDEFYQFSISKHEYGNKYCLMAETHQGQKWWVAGYLNNLNDINLPEWKIPYIIVEEKKLKQLLMEYQKNHAACPQCNSTKFRSTYVGYIMDVNHPEKYKDENKISCQCGWSGITHDLVPES